MEIGNPNAGKVDSSANLLQSRIEFKSSYEGDSKKRNLAFRQFKHTISEGMQQCYLLSCKKSELKEKKLLMQNLSVRLSDCKHEIHDLNLLVSKQALGATACEQAAEAAEQMISGNEQAQLQERLQQAKAEYQKCSAELLQIKAEIQSVRKEMLECQEHLLDSFFKWYKREKDN